MLQREKGFWCGQWEADGSGWAVVLRRRGGRRRHQSGGSSSWDHMLGGPPGGSSQVCCLSVLYWNFSRKRSEPRAAVGVLPGEGRGGGTGTLSRREGEEQSRSLRGGREQEGQCSLPLRWAGGPVGSPQCCHPCQALPLAPVARGWGFVWLEHELNHAAIRGRLSLCGAFILEKDPRRYINK